MPPPPGAPDSSYFRPFPDYNQDAKTRTDSAVANAKIPAKPVHAAPAAPNAPAVPKALSVFEEYEAKTYREAASKCRTTRELAAYLGTSQPTVVRRLKKYNITLSGRKKS